MKIRDRYDIIVIGSGAGGLASAAILADTGKSVLVIEKESRPGGYLTEFKRGAFTFDVSLHLVNGCGQGKYVSNVLKRCGIMDQIKFIKPKYLYRSVFPDMDIRVPQMDPRGYIDLLCVHFPRAKSGIEAFFSEISIVFGQMDGECHLPPITPLLGKYLKNNFQAILDQYMDDVAAKAVIAQLWMYFGLPPSMLRAVDFAYPCYDYMVNGGYYPEGGSYSIAVALEGACKIRGVDFIYNNRVEKILVRDHNCYGVMFNKELILCDSVISNSDARDTVFDLAGKEHYSQNSIEKIGRIIPSISAVEVFLGLNADLKAEHPDDYEIFVSGGYDLDAEYRSSLNGDVNKAPFAIGLYSNIDKEACSKGKSTATIIMLSGYDHWAAMSKNEYLYNKEKAAEALIARAARIIPELGNNIAVKTVSTPLTFERYTGNSKGALYGYIATAEGKDGIEVRPNELKDIRNLYFASAWARQGSGVMKALRSAEDVYRKISELENVTSLRRNAAI
jgi:phytoene dehydrogenase-like protein